MKNKFINLFIGLMFTAFIGLSLYLPEGDMPHILFVTFIVGGMYGFIRTVFAPLSDLTSKGIMWEYYIPQIIIIVMLINSSFQDIGYLFGVTIIILAIKNIIAIMRYGHNEIT